MKHERIAERRERLSDGWRSLLRILQILASATAVIARSSPRLLRSRWQGKRIEQWRILGESLAGLLERLGPVFVKLGQLLSVRRDLFPEELIAPLRRLQDKVAAVPFDTIGASLETFYGRPLDEVFVHFDKHPVACGSLAQVYRGCLREQAVEVAVKVLRPGTRAAIERDLRLLMAIGSQAARLQTFQQVPLLPALRQICDAIGRQTDFRAEASSCQRFHSFFSSRAQARFPQVLPRYSGSEVIVMAYFADLAKIDDETIEVQVYRDGVEEVLRVLYTMIFSQGFVHCDLHPGNVHLLPDGTPVILDCGLTVQMEDRERLAFRRFFLSLALGDGDVTAEILLQTSLWQAERFQESAFRRDVLALVKRHSGASAGRFQVIELVYELFDVQRRHGLCGSPAFTMTILSLLTFEGVVKTRYPDLDFQRVARPFFASFITDLLRMDRGVVMA